MTGFGVHAYRRKTRPNATGGILANVFGKALTLDFNGNACSRINACHRKNETRCAKTVLGARGARPQCNRPSETGHKAREPRTRDQSNFFAAVSTIFLGHCPKKASSGNVSRKDANDETVERRVASRTEQLVVQVPSFLKGNAAQRLDFGRRQGTCPN